MSIPSWCIVGARVVCIDDCKDAYGRRELVMGRIYTIVVVDYPHIRLDEIPPETNCEDAMYFTARFRPIVSQASKAQTNRTPQAIPKLDRQCRPYPC